MFRKFIVSILVLFGSLFLLPTKALAQEQFQIDSLVEYRIEESGVTKVTHEVTLTNLYSDLYATTYQLTLENISPENISASEGGVGLPVSISSGEGSATIQVSFNKALVGKGKSRKFKIVFTDLSFAKKAGEVWEVEIPRLSSKDTYSNYSVKLLVPISFGQEAYISPEPTTREVDLQKFSYLFTKDVLGEKGINAGFGKFQVFSFTLNYHLENPLGREAKTEIALPPDTSFQQMYYGEITPKPSSIDVDRDGNWIATYVLKARERIDVVAKGNVQIFSFPRRYYDENFLHLDDYLTAAEFWEVDNVQIKNLAESLKTPRNIYDYIVENLTYDYSRVRPNVERFGALKALNNKDVAICMEFTDLFVALTRAAGIPAREVNGFAYTENPEIQPLSLVADVLHAWPEYWDAEKQIWIAVDPTWASTSGINYFDKLDLRHFTFVVHGSDPRMPFPPGSYKLGKNPQKDVFVNFGKLPDIRASKPIIKATVTTPLPFIGGKVMVEIENPGPTALYEKSLKTYFDGEYEADFLIDSLYPFTSTTIEVPVPYSFLGKDTPDKITIAIDGSVVSVPTKKDRIIIYNLLVIFVILFIILAWYLNRTGRIHIRRVFKSINEKVRFKKTKSNKDVDQKTP